MYQTFDGTGSKLQGEEVNMVYDYEVWTASFNFCISDSLPLSDLALPGSITLDSGMKILHLCSS